MSSGEKKVLPNQWLVNIGGKQQGPFLLDQMKQMITEGRLPAEAMVWTPGMSEWKSWRQAPEFELLVSPAGRNWAAAAVPQISSQGTFVDFLVFRRMLTPIVIQIYFWIGVVMIVLVSLFWIFVAIKADSISWALMGFTLLIGGPITWRLYCEVVIIFFRMNETLTDIKNILGRK